MDVDIVVLGPVEARVDRERRMRGVAKDVQMLAVLALEPGRAVSLDELARRIWGEVQPAKPGASLHSYAARIRQKLGHERLVQQSHAYLLDLPLLAVDVHRWKRLVAQARSLSASGDLAKAVALLEEADALWRGEPLTGFSTVWAEQVRRRLAADRRSAALLRTEIELRVGHFAEVVDELGGLARQYPVDETVVRQFMVAAYGSGRQDHALRVYETLRLRLREVGTDPGQDLKRVYQGILGGTPARELTAGASAPRAAPTISPSLPARTRLFVGRDRELRDLRAAGAAVIAFQAISGMAGAGKTQLAVHAAHALAGEFPDGVVHINLRAHHPAQRPLTPEAALTSLLRDFDVPSKDIPYDLDDLVVLWRTVLGKRRAVVVLDDAVDVAQLRPLLPGDSGSLVLITSRRRLPGLPGARHVLVDVLAPQDAATLFATLAGIPPDEAREDVAELVRLCGCLPLALELVACRLSSRPAWSVGHMIRRMSQGPGPLPEIRDGGYEIASAFALSYEDLTADEQRVFRLLSLHFATAFGAHATAALVGLPLADTERILESLLDAHLLREPLADRYEFHDLIGAYSRSLVLRDPPDAREQALDGLADFYLHAVTAADLVLDPRRSRIDRGRAEPDGTPGLPDWSGPQQARGWLLAETDGLTGAEAHLHERGHHEAAARLADAANGFLCSEGLPAAAETMHTHALRHWTAVGHRSAQARALLALAEIRDQTGRYAEAERDSNRALALAQAVGDEEAEAEAYRSLWLLYWNLGRLTESLDPARKALDIRLRTGNGRHIARSRNNLGITLLHLGKFAGALECFRAALAGFIRERDLRGEAQALNNLGEWHIRRGQDDEAGRAFHRTLQLVTRFGTRAEQAIAQMNLADTVKAPDDLDRALDLYREALETFREIGDRRNEVVTLIGIGAALSRGGNQVEAAAHLTVALSRARDIGAAQEEAKALRGLGLTELVSGQAASAQTYLSQALAVARRTGSSEDEAHTRVALAEVHLDAGRVADALSHLRAAEALFRDLNEREHQRIRARIRGLTNP